MKKLLSLVLVASVLIPLSLYADSFNLTVLFCNGLDCGDTTSPTVPTNLVATPVSSSQINLSWDASIDPGAFASGVAGYGIYRNGSVSALATTTGLSYSDTGLSANTLYSYTVSAFDFRNNDSGQSSSVSTTTQASSSGAPNPSNGSPSGTFAAGTTQATLSLATDISATCKYGTTANTSYASIANTFTTTGGTSHSSNISSLANGVTYTYYIRCQSSSNVAMNSDYIISFSVAAASSGGGGGGGGSGASTPSYPTLPKSVIVRGVAYPGSTVTLLKDGQFVSSTVAGPDAKFEINFSGITEGTYTFNIWAKDVRGNRSVLFPFTIKLTQGATNVISGIFIPPTISIDKKQVRKGDAITVIGAANPEATVSVFFHSPVEIIKSVKADIKGLWSYTMDSIELDYGDHTTQARSKKDTDISSFSQTLGFKVGNSNIATVAEAQTISVGDLNNDNKVNLIDFSILLYWYKRPLTVDTPSGADMNGDKKINLVDFSIMAYHWTG